MCPSSEPTSRRPRPHRIDVDVDPTASGAYTFTIDGEPFPYEVASLALEEITPNSLPVLVLRLQADLIHIAHGFDV